MYLKEVGKYNKYKFVVGTVNWLRLCYISQGSHVPFFVQKCSVHTNTPVFTRRSLRKWWIITLSRTWKAFPSPPKRSFSFLTWVLNGGKYLASRTRYFTHTHTHIRVCEVQLQYIFVLNFRKLTFSFHDHNCVPQVLRQS